MGKNRFSYIIISVLLIIVLFSIIPFEDSFKSNAEIGIIEIKSPIIDSKKIIEDLNYFQNKENIDAIVVRLDTPGGGVAASQEIYEKVKSIALNNKPVIASMGGVAASGGYYIALGADTIVANPGTATGSIGVIMQYPIIKDLINDIGIKYETIKSADLKDSGSPFKNLNDNERNYFQNLIDDLHNQFINVVSLERNISIDIVDKLANGQVYSGKQALERKLIDLLGTFEDAIMIASLYSEYEGTPEILYPPKEEKGLLDRFIGDILQSYRISNFLQYPKPEYRIKYNR